MQNYTYKTQPFLHQETVLKKSWDRVSYAFFMEEMSWDKKAFAYFMEMGTGKSKVLIDNLAILHEKRKINGVLIVAPKGVYRNWMNQEFPKHLPERIKSNIICWTPSPKNKKKSLKL